jgi:hypothetical protein
MDAYDSHLVLSFVGETRLLAISEEDVLDEATIAGFDGDSQTLLAATTLHDQLLQVRLAVGLCDTCEYVPLCASGQATLLVDCPLA